MIGTNLKEVLPMANIHKFSSVVDIDKRELDFYNRKGLWTPPMAAIINALNNFSDEELAKKFELLRGEGSNPFTYLEAA